MGGVGRFLSFNPSLLDDKDIKSLPYIEVQVLCENPQKDITMLDWNTAE
jgi:hypothetical protein